MTKENLKSICFLGMGILGILLFIWVMLDYNQVQHSYVVKDKNEKKQYLNKYLKLVL